MMIFLFLALGLLLGLIVRKTNRTLNLERPTGMALLAMVFLLGVKTGQVDVNAPWLLGASLVFAALTMAGSLLLAGVMK